MPPRLRSSLKASSAAAQRSPAASVPGSSGRSSSHPHPRSVAGASKAWRVSLSAASTAPLAALAASRAERLAATAPPSFRPSATASTDINRASVRVAVPAGINTLRYQETEIIYLF